MTFEMRRRCSAPFFVKPLAVTAQHYKTALVPNTHFGNHDLLKFCTLIQRRSDLFQRSQLALLKQSS